MNLPIFVNWIVLLLSVYSLFNCKAIFASEKDSWASPLPYACRMDMDDHGIRCSGTYLNERVFLTSAHCFPEWWRDMGQRVGSKNSYSINCSNGGTSRVKAVAIYPKWINLGNHEDQLYPANTSGFENDIAVLITEKMALSKYGKLQSEPNAELIPGSCQRVGYAPQRCSSRVDDPACYQSGIILSKSLINYLYPIFTIDSNHSSGHGDSGSAFICNTTKEEEVVIATNSIPFSNPHISVPQKIDFIKSFLIMAPIEDILNLTETFQLSQAQIEIEEEALELTSLVKSFNKHMKEKGLKVSLSAYVGSTKIITKLLEYVKNATTEKILLAFSIYNSDERFSLKISHVSKSHLPKKITNIGKEIHFRRKNGFKTDYLYFTSKATLENILKVLRDGKPIDRSIY